MVSQTSEQLAFVHSLKGQSVNFMIGCAPDFPLPKLVLVVSEQ